MGSLFDDILNKQNEPKKLSEGDIRKMQQIKRINEVRDSSVMSRDKLNNNLMSRLSSEMDICRGIGKQTSFEPPFEQNM